MFNAAKQVQNSYMDRYDVARFWSRVEVRKQAQCWPWRYGPDEHGYGAFRELVGTRIEPAHRVAYMIAHGEIPEGKVIRHTCDNPLCCNPDHLEIGTHQDNVADRVARGRSAIGEDNGRSVLSTTQVQHIRESQLSARALAKHYGVDVKTITKIRSRETWAHV